MKILYANPIFLDYRLPFYKRLNELFKGDFYIMYSTKRYRLFGREKLCKRIKKEMGDNAIPFEDEIIFNTHEMSSKRLNVERGQQIPITKRLLRKIKEIKPDVLITEGFFQWTPLVLLYSILHRVPVFMGYERTLHTERNAGLLRKLHRKFTDKFIAGYLVNGSETKKYLLSIGVKEAKIHIGGMSADSEGLVSSVQGFPMEERQLFKQKFQVGKGLTFLFSGQIVDRKGLVYLLAAWEKHILAHKDDRLVIIGDGKLLPEFKKRCNALPSILFEGRVEYNEVYKYYAVADVFVLPTIEDNWSLVIPEAMACGLPVATSIYNGCHPELVKEGVNGITFDTFKEDSIVHALDYFHHQDLEAFGKQSVELEKPFNTEHCAQRVYDAICSTINGK